MTLTFTEKRRKLKKAFIYLVPLLLVIACDNDDDNPPTTIELVTAHTWIVDTYDVQLLSVTLPQEILTPIIDRIQSELVLGGVYTFKENTFTIDVRVNTIEGTWSLSADETEITMNIVEDAAFKIQEITADTFKLSYTTSESHELPGGSEELTFEITALLIPA